MMVYNIPVDAGIIIIVDKLWFNQHKDCTPRDDSYNEIEVEKGEYKVKWSIDDTWNGAVSGKGFLKVESGTVIVGDPCYWFDDNWHKILVDTDMFESETDWVLLDSMGGDGVYDVEVEFEE